MKKILLIGSNGLLGSSLSKVLSLTHNVVTVTRKSENSDFKCDLTSENESIKLFEKINPEIIINLAALTDVDTCEKNVQLAYLVNTKIAENISLYSKLNSTTVIHISTDHFYNKKNSCENDIEILNNYAMTKYCAEKAFISSKSVILRTNFFGKSESKYSAGLCNVFFNKVKNGSTLNLFHDVYFSPLSIKTLCKVITLCVEKPIEGIFNVGSREGLSKEEFLLTFLTATGLGNINYNSISIKDLELKTQRPTDMRMNVKHFEDTYQFKLPTLTTEIKRVANEFKQSVF
jgi:dTDP-4-dehydrorhamnose reductase